MPKSRSAKKILQRMKDKYGSEQGERVFYATANKQGRDPDTYKKESFKILGDLIVESAGIIIVISNGSEASDLNQHYVEKIIKNGIMVNYGGDCCIATDCEHNSIHYPDLVGCDVTELMDMVIDCAESCGFDTNIDVMETVGTGAIAMVPNALKADNEINYKKNKSKKSKS